MLFHIGSRRVCLFILSKDTHAGNGVNICWVKGHENILFRTSSQSWVRGSLVSGHLQNPQIVKSRKRTAVDMSDLVGAENPRKTENIHEKQ